MLTSTNKLSGYNNYFKDLSALAMPMVIGNLGQILIGITDVFVAAKHSINTLAAISISNAIIFTIFIIGFGLMSGISIYLSNHRGSRKPTKMYFKITVIYSLILALIFCAITQAFVPFIGKLGFDPKLVPVIKEYIFVVSFSFIGSYLFQGIKEFLQAHEIVNYPNILLISAVLINLVLKFIFVFGFGPIPAFGAIGLAMSTLMVRTLMGVLLLIYCYRLVLYNKKVNKTNYIKQLLKIGYPIGIALLLEFLAFNIITLYVGRIDGIYAATQSVVLTITNATFMIPLALSNAIAIKVGYYNGAKIYNELRNYSIIGVAMSTIFMAVCAAVLFIFPAQLIKIFTSDSEILRIGVPIVIIAALFQIFDGFQISASGILKGLKMTKSISIFVVSAYWLIGLPLGFLLSLRYGYTLSGFWIGLATALFFIGVIMGLRILSKFKEIKLTYK